MKRWNIHGDYDINIKGRVIYVKGSGIFNLECSQAYLSDMQEAVASLAGQPFAILVDFGDSEGATPDAYQYAETFGQWLSNQPLLANAYVTKSRLLQETMKKLLPSIAQRNVQFFTCVELAQEWVDSCMQQG